MGLDSCRKRARPIAFGAGMLPIALGFANDPSFRAPVAIVVIGGPITFTVLSLLVIPVVYSGVDDAMQWGWRRWAGASPTPLAPPTPTAADGTLLFS